MLIQRILVPLCLAVTLVSGCRTPWSVNEAAPSGSTGTFGKLTHPLEWGVDRDKPRSGEPQRVVATWVDSVRQQPGKPAERGFGGRIYFYDRGPDPITIDGRLVVYAFDEEGRNPTDHKPTRRYVFPAAQITQHMSASEIGPSYSVWLPWGAADGPATHVSLIARFEPLVGGGLVVSDQAKQWLPGQGVAAPDAGQRMLAEEPSARGVRQAAFNDRPTTVPRAAKSADADEQRRRMSTTTISLPKR